MARVTEQNRIANFTEYNNLESFFNSPHISDSTSSTPSNSSFALALSHTTLASPLLPPPPPNWIQYDAEYKEWSCNEIKKSYKLSKITLISLYINQIRLEIDFINYGDGTLFRVPKKIFKPESRSLFKTNNNDPGFINSSRDGSTILKNLHFGIHEKDNPWQDHFLCHDKLNMFVKYEDEVQMAQKLFSARRIPHGNFSDKQKNPVVEDDNDIQIDDAFNSFNAMELLNQQTARIVTPTKEEIRKLNSVRKKQSKKEPIHHPSTPFLSAPPSPLPYHSATSFSYPPSAELQNQVNAFTEPVEVANFLSNPLLTTATASFQQPPPPPLLSSLSASSHYSSPSNPAQSYYQQNITQNNTYSTQTQIYTTPTTYSSSNASFTNNNSEFQVPNYNSNYDPSSTSSSPDQLVPEKVYSLVRGGTYTFSVTDNNLSNQNVNTNYYDNNNNNDKRKYNDGHDDDRGGGGDDSTQKPKKGKQSFFHLPFVSNLGFYGQNLSHQKSHKPQNQYFVNYHIQLIDKGWIMMSFLILALCVAILGKYSLLYFSPNPALQNLFGPSTSFETFYERVGSPFTCFEENLQTQKREIGNTLAHITGKSYVESEEELMSDLLRQPNYLYLAQVPNITLPPGGNIKKEIWKEFKKGVKEIEDPEKWMLDPHRQMDEIDSISKQVANVDGNKMWLAHAQKTTQENVDWLNVAGGYVFAFPHAAPRIYSVTPFPNYVYTIHGSGLLQIERVLVKKGKEEKEEEGEENMKFLPYSDKLLFFSSSSLIDTTTVTFQAKRSVDYPIVTAIKYQELQNVVLLRGTFLKYIASVRENGEKRKFTRFDDSIFVHESGLFNITVESLFQNGFSSPFTSNINFVPLVESKY